MNELITTFHIEWSQFIAQLVNFTIAMTVLWFLIGRTLSRTLAERRTVIQKGVENGIESETILNQSKLDAAAVISEAEREALRLTAAAAHSASDTIAEAEHRAFLIERDLIKKAEEDARQVYDSQMLAKKQETVHLLVSVAESIIRKELSQPNAHSDLIAAKIIK